MAGEIAAIQTTVQDFRNKSLAPLQQGLPGGGADPTGMSQFKQPGLPSSGGAALKYNERLSDTATQSMSSHARLLGQIQRKQQMMRAQQGRGMTGATSQVLSGAGRGAAGGAGGAYGLQKNAAGALARMDAAYRARWGTGLVINDGGRSYEDQVRAWNDYQNGGNLAAYPGTSVHEQGRAVDFGGAIQNSGSAQHQWLQQVAGQYGFSWTGRTFSQVEPWHWEYVGS